MDHANQFLGTERIGTLMRRYAIPCIISLLVGSLYNIVDQIFIANASYLGSYGNAANTVVFPLTVEALAVAVMIGDGCCAFVSISLGKQEAGTAKQSVGNAVVMTVISSLALTAVYLLFPGQIVALFGAANESAYYTQFAVRAFRTYLCMMIFACVNKACFIFLQAMGKAAASTALSMIREAIFGVGFALVLPLWFGLDGVLYSMPVSDLLTFLVAMFLIAGTYKELNKKGALAQ